MSKRKKEDPEFDLHVWIEPEDENSTALYTLSIGKQLMCRGLPLDNAMDHLRSELEERGGTK